LRAIEIEEIGSIKEAVYRRAFDKWHEAISGVRDWVERLKTADGVAVASSAPLQTSKRFLK
jgi:hypothetical protein